MGQKMQKNNMLLPEGEDIWTILSREESEAIRYRDIHNIDIRNMDIYDLIINTDSFNPEGIAEIIITTLKVI